jgi:ribonuclease-3
MNSETSRLEEKIGFTFQEPALLQEALTHRSYLNEKTDWQYPHNERLEYLGDAVLELIITEALYRKFPQHPEGQLTVLRAALVNYQILSRIASDDLVLQDFLHMSKGEAKDTGKAREVILANGFEALVGALYLDRGYDACKTFIHAVVLPHLDEIVKTKSYKDAKSTLQELTQEKLKITPSYQVISQEGPAHQRIFTVGVFLQDKMIASGEGASKQEAETEAAKQALTKKKYF